MGQSAPRVVIPYAGDGLKAAYRRTHSAYYPKAVSSPHCRGIEIARNYAPIQVHGSARPCVMRMEVRRCVTAFIPVHVDRDVSPQALTSLVLTIRRTRLAQSQTRGREDACDRSQLSRAPAATLLAANRGTLTGD